MSGDMSACVCVDIGPVLVKPGPQTVLCFPNNIYMYLKHDIYIHIYIYIYIYIYISCLRYTILVGNLRYHLAQMPTAVYIICSHS